MDEILIEGEQPGDESFLKAMHSSLAIRWGTTAPYEIGRVRCERVGFAGDPCVVVDVAVKQRDIGGLVPIVRQRVYRELAERGWGPNDVEFSCHIGGSYRERIFTDANEESESFGRRKYGSRLEFRFLMMRDLAKATFDPRVRPGQSGSFATLPDR